MIKNEKHRTHRERSVKVPFLLPLCTLPFKHTLQCVSCLNMIIITDRISVSGSRSTSANIPFHTLHKGISFFNLVALTCWIVKPLPLLSSPLPTSICSESAKHQVGQGGVVCAVWPSHVLWRYCFVSWSATVDLLECDWISGVKRLFVIIIKVSLLGGPILLRPSGVLSILGRAWGLWTPTGEGYLVTLPSPHPSSSLLRPWHPTLERTAEIGLGGRSNSM